MKTILAAFIALLPAFALGASAPRTPEAAWSGALEAGRARITAQAPKSVSVKMTLDRGAAGHAVINEPALGINVDVSRSGPDSFWINGYLKGSAQLLDRRTTSGGATISGGGIAVDIRPSGGQVFVLKGAYKNAQGKDGSMNVRLIARGLPVRDLSVHEKGLDLYLRWRSAEYEIEGKADPALYGKRELAIIGAAVSAVTWDAVGR